MPVRVSSAAVPSERPRSGSLGRARPKSSSFTPWRVRNTLDGLRSRWTMPRACNAWSAASTSRPMGTVSDTLSGPRRSRSPSASPSRSSMAMNSSPRPAVRARNAGGPLRPWPATRSSSGRQSAPAARRAPHTDAHATLSELAGDRVVTDARRQVGRRGVDGSARRSGRRRRHPRHPVVEGAQPSRGRVVAWFLRHGNADHTCRTPPQERPAVRSARGYMVRNSSRVTTPSLLRSRRRNVPKWTCHSDVVSRPSPLRSRDRKVSVMPD